MMKDVKTRTAKKKIDSSASRRIGTLIQEKRLELGFPLEKVASYLNVSPATIRLYESGENPIPLNHIYGISNCLNISPQDILRLINET